MTFQVGGYALPFMVMALILFTLTPAVYFTLPSHEGMDDKTDMSFPTFKNAWTGARYNMGTRLWKTFDQYDLVVQPI